MSCNTHSRQASIDPQAQPTAHITELDPVQEEELTDTLIQITDTLIQITPPQLPAENIILTSPVVEQSQAHHVLPLITHANTPNDSNLHMTEALSLLTQELIWCDSSAPPPAHKQAKGKDPDTFDTTEPKKLNNFILLCNLYFWTNPAYSNNTTKIMFALSYLLGMALEYFEPTLLETDDSLDWLEDWDAYSKLNLVL